MEGDGRLLTSPRCYHAAPKGVACKAVNVVTLLRSCPLRACCISSSRSIKSPVIVGRIRLSRRHSAAAARACAARVCGVCAARLAPRRRRPPCSAQIRGSIPECVHARKGEWSPAPPASPRHPPAPSRGMCYRRCTQSSGIARLTDDPKGEGTCQEGYRCQGNRSVMTIQLYSPPEGRSGGSPCPKPGMLVRIRWGRYARGGRVVWWKGSCRCPARAGGVGVGRCVE